MSWVFLSDTPCKARKAHRCRVCDEMINRGDSQIVRRGAHQGEAVISDHFHSECEQYSKRFSSDEWESGDFEISRKQIQDTMEKEKQITAKNGLLWQFGKAIPLPCADSIAIEKGFTCAEQYVRYLEAKSGKRVSLQLLDSDYSGSDLI